MHTSMDAQTILIHLALKLGVAAAVSSSLVRSKEFKLLLFREERNFRQKVYLVLCMALPIMAGVWIRLSCRGSEFRDRAAAGRDRRTLGGFAWRTANGPARFAAWGMGGDAFRCALRFYLRPTAHHGAG